MKRSIKLAAIAALVLSVSSALYAEPGSTGSSIKNHVVVQKIGVRPDINATTSELGVRTAEYEQQLDDTTKAWNVASLQTANLLSMSHTANMQASAINNIERMQPTLTSLLTNADKFFDRLVVVAPRYKSEGDKVKSMLKKVYAYNFGPSRPDSISIKQVSNEGKGTVMVGARAINYVVAPGLTATKQNEREVIAIERLSDGEYKIATGIFYAGQEIVLLNWDERTYTRVDYFLDYHNVKSADLQDWLKCGKSLCVAYSENKTVNTSK